MANKSVSDGGSLLLTVFGKPHASTPVCENSQPESQCNWCDNPECPDEDCGLDWLWCCSDTDDDGVCDMPQDPTP